MSGIILEQTSVKGILTTDCKSLFDLISRTAPPACQEFRTQLQAKLIKEHLHNGIQIRWEVHKLPMLSHQDHGLFDVACLFETWMV